ncbi:hypothetical protein E2320_014462 [Naja naja]|nr:hypothetical protein E2320_014462 [Naja naja]
MIFSLRILQPASLEDRSTQTIFQEFSAPSMSVQIVSRMRHASGRNYMSSKYIGGVCGSDKTRGSLIFFKTLSFKYAFQEFSAPSMSVHIVSRMRHAKRNIICSSKSDILAMQTNDPDFAGIGGHQRIPRLLISLTSSRNTGLIARDPFAGGHSVIRSRSGPASKGLFWPQALAPNYFEFKHVQDF